ncbi:MAG: sugar ABC transporter substrate-binding protein [Clostridia bacterium]
MRKVIVLLVALLFVTSMFLGGCAPKAAPTAESTTPGSTAVTPKIVVITQALNSEYWNGFAQGAKDAGKEVGADITVNGPMAETMVTEQIAMIEAEISKKPAAILVAANQPGSIKPTFEAAKKAGIPIMEVDVESEWDGRVAYVGAGNYEGGKKAGEWFISHLPEGSEIAVIRGALGDPTHDLRVNGCLDAIKAAGDKLKVVSIQPANSERGLAVGVMENILTANPNIKGAFCSNDEMALGALKATQGVKKDVKIIGFDGNMDALNSIKEGKLAASISCVGYDIANLAVKTMKEVLDGKKLESDRILLEPICVDITNVNDNIKKVEEIVAKVKANK